MHQQSQTPTLEPPAGETVAQPALHLQQIYEGQAEYSTSFELVNRYTSDSRFKGLGFQAGQWFETNSDVYWYFLECLPPLHQSSGGFVVSECTMNGLHECFFEIDERYYYAVIDWTGQQSFAALWTALLAEVAL